jgi:hypothetical protein
MMSVLVVASADDGRFMTAVMVFRRQAAFRGSERGQRAPHERR